MTGADAVARLHVRIVDPDVPADVANSAADLIDHVRRCEQALDLIRTSVESALGHVGAFAELGARTAPRTAAIIPKSSRAKLIEERDAALLAYNDHSKTEEEQLAAWRSFVECQRLLAEDTGLRQAESAEVAGAARRTMHLASAQIDLTSPELATPLVTSMPLTERTITAEQVTALRKMLRIEYDRLTTLMRETAEQIDRCTLAIDMTDHPYRTEQRAWCAERINELNRGAR